MKKTSNAQLKAIVKYQREKTGLIRLRKDIKDKLQEIAKKNHRSMAQQIELWLEQELQNE